MNIKIKTQNLKGFRDFLPSEAIARNYVIGKIKKVFEKYGFDPLETPALEYGETLLGKYGDEADKLLYLFEDRGKRKVGLRYDQTVPLARIVAQYQNLPKPFKRYQIQPVWRAENTQKGRYREFLQCDIDTIGEKNVFADAEIINCALDTIKSLGFKNTKMLINDRLIFGNIDGKYIITMDKLQKIGREGVINELISKGMSKEEADKLIESFAKKSPNENLKKLFETLKQSGLQDNIDFQFSPTLARGLDYYTGTIFELISKDYDAGSLGGGGRYDKLIGQFTSQEFPAVGFAFGFDRIVETMFQLNLIPKKLSSTKVLVTTFSLEQRKNSLDIVEILRKNDINTEINLNEELKLDKQLKYADKKMIPYAIIIGPEEVKKKIIKIKDLKTGEQKEFSQKELLEFLKSN